MGNTIIQYFLIFAIFAITLTSQCLPRWGGVSKLIRGGEASPFKCYTLDTVLLITVGEVLLLVLYCLECLVEVVDEVLIVLCTDAQANCSVVDSLLGSFLVAELRVSCALRVNDQ